MYPDKNYPHHQAHKFRTLVILIVGFIGSVIVNDAPLLRTSILMVDTSGQTQEEVRKEVKQKIQKFQTKQIPFHIGEKTYYFTPKELGVTFEIEKTMQNAYQTEKPALEKFKVLLTSLIQPRQIAVTVDVDEKKLQKTLVAKTDELDDPEKVAVKFYKGEFKKHSEKYIGATTDYKKVKHALEQSLSQLENAPIEVPLMPREYTRTELDQAQKETEKLQNAVLRLRAYTPVGEKIWTIELKYRPAWILQTKTENGISVSLNSDSIRAYLNTAVRKQVYLPSVDANVTALPETGNMYAEVSEIAMDGASLQLNEAVTEIVKSVARGNFDITLPMRIAPAKIVNKTGVPLGELKLIAEGRSNFVGSPENREFNIKKGLKEKFSNILIPPGGTFSYNSFLGPVTEKYGWKDALAIFGGGGVRKVPGGGLCQVSTTVYRAALLAGLDIRQRSNHSLYVSYYTKNGEGLDATIYPGSRDFIFQNNTGNYILMQGYTVDNDAYVRLYGTSDGRAIKLFGPYRWREVTKEILRGHQRGWDSKDIVWFQEITKKDGTVEYNKIISRYKKPIPWNKPEGAELIVSAPAA